MPIPTAPFRTRFLALTRQTEASSPSCIPTFRSLDSPPSAQSATRPDFNHPTSPSAPSPPTPPNDAAEQRGTETQALLLAIRDSLRPASSRGAGAGLRSITPTMLRFEVSLRVRVPHAPAGREIEVPCPNQSFSSIPTITTKRCCEAARDRDARRVPHAPAGREIEVGGGPRGSPFRGGRVCSRPSN